MIVISTLQNEIFIGALSICFFGIIIITILGLFGKVKFENKSHLNTLFTVCILEVVTFGFLLSYKIINTPDYSYIPYEWKLEYFVSGKRMAQHNNSVIFKIDKNGHLKGGEIVGLDPTEYSVKVDEYNDKFDVNSDYSFTYSRDNTVTDSLFVEFASYNFSKKKFTGSGYDKGGERKVKVTATKLEF